MDDTRRSPPPPTIVLWDFENAGVPTGVSGLFVARQLQTVFGRSSSIRSIQAFGNSVGIPPRLLEELAIGGIKFIEVKKTAHGRKDVADKLILTEIFLFAMDNPPPATIILISGDVDFSNALSALKFRGYRIVLVPPHTPSRLLLQIPDEVVHWSHIVQPLDSIDESKAQSLRASAELRSMSIPTSNRPSSSSPQQDARHLDTSIDGNGADPAELLGDENDVVNVEDFLDVCLLFVEQGMTKVLASRAGLSLKEKYPRGFYKGCLKVLIEQAVTAGWLTTEGTGGSYTLVFNIDAMDQAWTDLLPL